jgi:hypothetical protein
MVFSSTTAFVVWAFGVDNPKLGDQLYELNPFGNPDNKTTVPAATLYLDAVADTNVESIVETLIKIES